MIRISNINDFLFCPVSIYYHGLMEDADNVQIQSEYQIYGTAAHESIDGGTYSSRRNILQGADVCSLKYGLIGKIDTFDVATGILRERKKHISIVYPGYVFQLYGQYFGLVDAGYVVTAIQLYSMDDNKTHPVLPPEKNPEMLKMFEDVLEQMRSFDVSHYVPENSKKCRRCIYAPLCPNGAPYDE